MSLNNGFANSTIVSNQKKEVDIDALNLLASGEISEFCLCSYKNEKKHHHFIYSTQDMIALAQMQAGMTFENVVDILAAAVRMIGSVQKYNLVLDNIKNSKAYIFRDDSEYKFVYLPLVHKTHLTVRDFFLKLLSVIHHKDVRLNLLIKELKKKKENTQALSYLTAFVASYTALENDTGCANAEGETTVLSRGSTASEEAETTVLSREEDGDFIQISGYRTTAFFQDTSGECETTVLTSQPVLPAQPVREINGEYHLYLIRSLNGERVSIDITPFTIGKDRANMDLVLNNDSISRHHATVLCENGEYFIVDNHSTNGTVVEGIKLQPEEKCEIGNGYILSLGSESFQACIERR